MSTESKNTLVFITNLVCAVSMFLLLAIWGYMSENEATHIRQYQNCLEATNGNKEYCGWSKK